MKKAKIGLCTRNLRDELNTYQFIVLLYHSEAGSLREKSFRYKSICILFVYNSSRKILVQSPICYLFHFSFFSQFLGLKTDEKLNKPRFQIHRRSQKSKIGHGKVLVKLVSYIVDQIINGLLQIKASI